MLTASTCSPSALPSEGLSVPVKVTDGEWEVACLWRWGHCVILERAGRVTVPALTCSLTSVGHGHNFSGLQCPHL